jgi:hypothetical protein
MIMKITATKKELWAMLFRAHCLVDDLRCERHLTKFGREQVKKLMSRKCSDCANYRLTMKTIEDWLKAKRGYDKWYLDKLKKEKDKSRKIGLISCVKGYPLFAEVCSSWKLTKNPSSIMTKRR